MQLTNKTILITGANGGFGQQFIRQLLEKENNLILTDLDAEVLTETALAIEKEVGRGQILTSIGSDLSTKEGVQALFDQVEELGRPVDVLINNAGVGLMGRHDEVPQERWEQLMQINLLAPMRLCALFIPLMIERQQGHIINISSIAGWTTDPGLSAYVASKFGLRGFSATLYDELKEHNIQVSAVYPFFSRTPIIESPRFGTLANRVPADVSNIPGITEPADVVQSVIKQAEAGTLHIFTDATGRFIYRLLRFPRLANVLKRYLVKADS